MYCTNCGAKNISGSKYCKNCGQELKNIESSARSKQYSSLVSKDISPFPYSISIQKLIVLSVFTFGLFQIYWFYKQWKSVKAEQNLKITPWARAIFATFLSYSLFKEISKMIMNKDVAKGLEAGALAIAYFFLVLAYRLPDPYSWVGLLSFLPLIPAQTAINSYWDSKIGDRLVKSGFGLWNWITVIVGGIIFILIIIGYLYPNENTSTAQLKTVTPTKTLTKVNVSKSVVNLLCDNGNGGSGTVWLKEGLIVTNYHVIKGSSSCLVTVPDPDNGEPKEIYEGEPLIVNSLSSLYDIAMVNIYAAYRDDKGKVWGKYPISLETFTFPKNCSIPKLGDSLRIYGYPVTSGGYNLTITDGIISSFAEDGNILTSAKIDSGNSGGLAMDKDGCMLGIPSAVLTGDYQNLGVVIPVNVISDFFAKANSLDSSTIFQASTDSQVTPQSQKSQTNEAVDCVGPDGNHMFVTAKQCNDFQMAWSNSGPTQCNSCGPNSYCYREKCYCKFGFSLDYYSNQCK